MKSRRLLSFLLALVLILSCCPMAGAVTVYHSGNWGDNLTWTLDDEGTLIISGEGDMQSPPIYSVHFPWEEHANDIRRIRIMEGVTSIAASAFQNCYNLAIVELPEGLTSIGRGAFYYCESLTSLNIPASVTSIGDSCFTYCSSLTALTVANGSQHYSSRDGVLFDKGMKTVILCPEGKETTSYTIPSGVTAIGNEAFSGNEHLTTVYIPNGVTTIGDMAFSNCTSLATVDLPNTLTAIGESAFTNCWGLTEMVIPDGVRSIGANAFSGSFYLSTINIPAGITVIEDLTFNNCPITSITIPEGVTSIGKQAFYGGDFTDITIPASVTEIGPSAFARTALTSITFVGNAPTFLDPIGNDPGAFDQVTATCYYPGDNATWARYVGYGLGGALTWEPYDASPNSLSFSPATTTIHKGQTATLSLVLDNEIAVLGGTLTVSIKDSSDNEVEVTSIVPNDNIVGCEVSHAGSEILVATLGTIEAETKIADIYFATDSNTAADTYTVTVTTELYTGDVDSNDNDVKIDFVVNAGTIKVTEKPVTVIWANEDGTVLETNNNVPYGTTPEYSGATPTKESTAEYNYTFAGWSPAVSEVTQDTTYTATYNAVKRSYAVTWNNEDGTNLETDINVLYGTTPEYNGATPTKESTAEYNYTFAGWSPAVDKVTGDVTYTATYTAEKRSYTVTWKNADGTIIDTTTVEYGALPTHAAPTKDKDIGYTYTFATWNPAISAVTGDITYEATYTKDARTYAVSVSAAPDNPNIVIKDKNGTNIQASNSVYNLTYNETYSYKITAIGYETVEGSFILYEGNTSLTFTSGNSTATLTISNMQKFVGDQNGDGAITITDAQALYNYILGEYTPNADGLVYIDGDLKFNLNVADINGNGTVGADDILPMLRLINSVAGTGSGSSGGSGTPGGSGSDYGGGVIPV